MNEEDDMNKHDLVISMYSNHKARVLIGVGYFKKMPTDDLPFHRFYPQSISGVKSSYHGLMLLVRDIIMDQVPQDTKQINIVYYTSSSNQDSLPLMVEFFSCNNEPAFFYRHHACNETTKELLVQFKTMALSKGIKKITLQPQDAQYKPLNEVFNIGYGMSKQLEKSIRINKNVIRATNRFVRGRSIVDDLPDDDIPF